MNTEEAIQEALRRHPNARRIAVVNFVSSAGSNGMHNALNLEQDRKAYGWNSTTVQAIKYGLRLCGKM